MPRSAAAAAIALLLAAWVSPPTSAHVTIVSPYTFHEHVLPILRARCGVCHNGNSPGRPLLDYEAAARNEVELARAVMVGRMPPWSAEAGASAFKGQTALTPREVDIIMTWAGGGTPEGKPIAASAAPAPPPSAFGTPGLTLQMPETTVLDGSHDSAVHEAVFAAAAARGRAIRAVDVIPGDPAIVRRAEVAIRTGAGDRTIALWAPGDTPQTLEADAAYPVPRDASLVLRVYYLRQPAAEPRPRSDRSTLALYFSTTRNAPQPRELLLEGSGIFRVDTPRSVTLPISRTVRALALRPVSGPVDAIVTLDIVSPSGERRPLARLQLRTEWPRRYIFATPVTLPAGSRIEARVVRRDPMLWSPLTGDAGIPADEPPLRIAIETIA